MGSDLDHRMWVSIPCRGGGIGICSAGGSSDGTCRKGNVGGEGGGVLAGESVGIRSRVRVSPIELPEAL